MLRLAALAAILALLSGCDNRQPESSLRASDSYRVDKLFTVDGCTLYRFLDRSHYRYFTNCSGSTNYTTSSGKISYPDGVAGGQL